MAFVTPDGEVMDMDTGPVGALASQFSTTAATFVSELTSLLAEADAIEGTIGQGPMGRDFVRNIGTALYDTKKMAEILGVLAEERARSVTSAHGHYVAAADASDQAFGSA